MTHFVKFENLSKETYDDEDLTAAKENFYEPLSLSGYLTPLQRKKLREKRNFQSSLALDVQEQMKGNKLQGIKRKKEHLYSVSSQSKAKRKRKRSREPIPQLLRKTLSSYAASKIILKSANRDINNKKFFKASSPNRLEKASYNIKPFVSRKNLSLSIEKCAKENICYPVKKPSIERKLGNVVEGARSAIVMLASSEQNSSNLKCEIEIPAVEVTQISDILSHGDTGNENGKQSSEEKNIFDFDWPDDEFFLKREQRARAKLRNSLRDSRVLAKQNCSEETKITEQHIKLFPIFHMAKKKQQKNKPDVKSRPRDVHRKVTESSRKGGEQMIIDAGQKVIGAKLCATCNMIYTVGQEEDEKLHSDYHNTYLVNLKFHGWKEENVIGEYRDGRVIMVKKNEKSLKIKKIEDILVIVNRDLGFPSSAVPTKPDLTFVLFISNTKQVSGCIIAELITSACQVLSADDDSTVKKLSSDQTKSTWRIGNWYSSLETVPAICGINRIWVAHDFRRQKIASRMIDCLRCNFIHGHVVGIRELAFTDPSPDGREFAAAYTGTDNFLVYK